MNSSETELEIGKMITALAMMYPSVQIGEETINAYVSILKYTPLDVLTAAIEQCTRECKFFPTVAEISERAFQISSPLASNPNGITKWGEVKSEMRRTGFYRTPRFEDPMVAQAVHVLGWQHLCTSENEEADRAHFARIYDNLLAQQIQDAKLLPRAREIRRQIQEMNGAKEIGDGRGF